ncbi:DUF6746 family protein [Vreelandella aquamarina]|uniref:DUF6746 family protein n=1 Tax=Vreelandella aquamarina TaxID=77097 RepID=UPI00384C947A
MKRISIAIVAGLLSSGIAFADEQNRMDHFEGEASETLTQALENMAEGNQRLAELLGAEALTDEQMGEIHMLTYTLENALQRVDQEVESMAVSLEEVHLGSESLDQERVAINGADYLDAAAPFVQ